MTICAFATGVIIVSLGWLVVVLWKPERLRGRKKR